MELAGEKTELREKVQPAEGCSVTPSLMASIAQNVILESSKGSKELARIDEYHPSSSHSLLVT
jgi:hypothetical protein